MNKAAFRIVFRHKSRKEAKPIYCRYNNGGWNKSHGQIEETPRIDSFEAMKQGDDGALYASNAVLDCDHFVEYGPGDTEREIVELSYPGSRWTQTLRLTRMNSGFGGTRAFWMCPQCKRRVRYLYFKGRGFMCRECAGLNYRSQQQAKGSMFWYWKGVSFAENKLALSPDLRPDGFDFCEYIPERPKGMHGTTYNRYLSRFLKYRERHTARKMADMKKIIGPAGWMEIMRMMNEK